MALTQEKRNVLDSVFGLDSSTIMPTQDPQFSPDQENLERNLFPSSAAVPENLTQKFDSVDAARSVAAEQFKRKYGEITEAGEEPTLLTNPGGTIARSFKRSVYEPMKQLITSPIETGWNIIKLGSGLFEKGTQALLPEDVYKPIFNKPSYTIEYADALGNFYKERYGSLEKAKKTALTDPIGFLQDASMALGGASAVAKGFGSATGSLKLANLGDDLAKVSKVIDPISTALNSTSKLLRKGSEAADKTDPALKAAALQMDIDLPASAYVDDVTTPLLEGIASKSFSGKKLAQKVATAQDDLIKIADDLTVKAGKVDDLTAAGDILVDGFMKYQNKFDDLLDDLYAPINERASDVPGIMDNTVATLEDIITSKKDVLGKPKDLKFFQDIADDISKMNKPKNLTLFPDIADDISKKGNKITFNTLKKTRTQVGQMLKNKIDPFSTGNRTQLERLYSSLTDDMALSALQDSPELAKQLEIATNTYKTGVNKINSVYGKKLLKYQDQPSKIVKSLTSNNIPIEDIPRIYEMVGEEGTRVLQGQFLDNLFSKSKVSGKNIVSPNKLQNQLNKLGDGRLSAILTPKQVQAVNDISKVAQSFGKLDKITKGSQTAFLNRIVKQAGILGASTLAGTALNNPWAIAAGVGYILGQEGLSLFVASKLGQDILRQGLTSGLMLGGLMKVGAQLTGSPLTKATQQTMRITQQALEPKKDEENRAKVREIFGSEDEQRRKVRDIFQKRSQIESEGSQGPVADVPDMTFSKVSIPKSARLAKVNNNPGNLRLAGQKGAVQGKGGFAKFPTPQAGAQALYDDLKAKITGNSPAIRSKLGRDAETLAEVISVYAPKEDYNDPKSYAQFVAKKLGVSPNEPVGNLVSRLPELVKAFALKESSTKLS